MYLSSKFEVSSKILSRFRLGGGGVILPPSLPPENKSLKGPLRLGLSITELRNIKQKSQSALVLHHQSFWKVQSIIV